MNNLFTQIKPFWPVLASATGLLLALLIAVRYKIPDLTRRIEAMEKKGANSTDLERAIEGFRTVCKFNQVTCQKENQHGWTVLRKEFDEKFSDLHEKLNSLAVSNAELIAKVELLINDRKER